MLDFRYEACRARLSSEDQIMKISRRAEPEPCSEYVRSLLVSECSVASDLALHLYSHLQKVIVLLVILMIRLAEN